MSAFNSKLLPLKVLTSTTLLSVLLSLPASVHADVTYGPVQARDTLSKIVNRFYSGENRPSISLMKTILANNPQAFIRGDMNLLRRGALLVLPSDNWLVNDPRFVTPRNRQIKLSQRTTQSDLGISNLPNRTPEQMMERIIFLEAERLSLINQVENLKQETAKLTSKIEQLELESRTSDDQLLVLDQEIVRLTNLLEEKGGVVVSTGDLSQLAELQQQLQTAQQETEELRTELSTAKTELANNSLLKTEADKSISELTQENRQLQHLLQQSQPGVHYFGEASGSDQLSFMGGKFKLPLWVLILGGSLFSLVMIALLATRRKKAAIDSSEFESEQQDSASIISYDSLLETSGDDMSAELEQATNAAEENVFKMFDEGTLEMDLKLDMAEAYLQVSDFDLAKSVLQEVMDGGTELQQRKAARLMKQAA